MRNGRQEERLLAAALIDPPFLLLRLPAGFMHGDLVFCGCFSRWFGFSEGGGGFVLVLGVEVGVGVGSGVGVASAEEPLDSRLAHRLDLALESL